jgi:transcriptional regulator with XRE-family HTH domain
VREKKTRKKINSPLSANLKKVLAENKLSIRKAAEICGVQASMLHSWLNGAQPQDMGALLKLCQECGVEFQWLVTGVSSREMATKRLEEIFDIQPEPSLSGLFLIEAKRLKRKGT